MGFSVVPMALAGVGAVTSLVQQVSEGMNRSANFENQARAAGANSRVAAMNASIAGSQGKIEAAQAALDWHKQLGRQRAAMAQGGVLESPTGLLAREEAEGRARDDLFQIGLQSDLKKQGLEFQAADLRSQAAAARGNSKSARLSGWLGGLSSFAAGAGKAVGYGLDHGVFKPSNGEVPGRISAYDMIYKVK